jgi:hypothetical protein
LLESPAAGWLRRELGSNYNIQQHGGKFLISRPGYKEEYLVSVNV